MSEQNNMNQGYPQQNYQQVNQQGYPQQQYQQMNQQGYPQQQYQQMNQQGYPQQQYQQMNQQGYPQQYQQMNQGYVGQGYQQPTGGGKPPKGNKPKTGLIVGIVIGAIALIAGIILLVFKDKIFGEKDITEPTETVATTEAEPDTAWEITEDLTTEESYDEEGGYDTADELVSNFWEGFAYCDKDQIYQCFYLEYEPCAKDAETLYNDSVAHAYDLEIDLDGMTTTFEETSTEGLADFGKEVWGAKLYYANIPMTQEKDGQKYEFIEKYEGVAFQLENGKWYIASQKSLGVEILTIDGVPVDDTTTSTTTEPEETGDTKPMGNDDCGYVDVPTDWVRFADVNDVDGTEASYQISDPIGSTIVTMCVIDIDPYTAACNMYNGLASEEDTIEVVDAMATIGGYEAYQVYAVYEDEYFVTYFFETEDGKYRYVAIEFPINQAGSTVVQTVESSFRLTE